jgi:hypothetical protein
MIENFSKIGLRSFNFLSFTNEFRSKEINKIGFDRFFKTIG